jgi:hypothetical protein
VVRVAIADEDVGAGRWGWCHGLLRSRSVRRRSISPTPLEQTEVLSRLQPEWRISGWSGQLQGKASARRVRRAEPRRWRERVPWAGCRSVAFAHPTPPYTDRATGLLIPIARNRIRFIEIAIRFRQNASNIPTRQTAPSFLNDRYPAENLWSRSPALANSGVASHRHRDPAPAGRGMCWMLLQAWAAGMASVIPKHVRAERRRPEAD